MVPLSELLGACRWWRRWTCDLSTRRFVVEVSGGVVHGYGTEVGWSSLMAMSLRLREPMLLRDCRAPIEVAADAINGFSAPEVLLVPRLTQRRTFEITELAVDDVVAVFERTQAPLPPRWLLPEDEVVARFEHAPTAQPLVFDPSRARPFTVQGIHVGPGSRFSLYRGGRWHPAIAVNDPTTPSGSAVVIPGDSWSGMPVVLDARLVAELPARTGWPKPDHTELRAAS